MKGQTSYCNAHVMLVIFNEGEKVRVLCRFKLIMFKIILNTLG